MPHNLVVTKEGALETVGLAAEAMAAQPDAFAKRFIPKTPEVLFAIRLLQPGETIQARFTAPAAARQLPVRLHLPRPLADDERHRRGRAAGRSELSSSSHDPSLRSSSASAVLAAGPSPSSPPQAPRAPHVVFVTGDDEYRSEDHDADARGRSSRRRHGMRTSVAYATPTRRRQDHIEGLEALDTADLMVMFTRLPGPAGRRAEPDPRRTSNRASRSSASAPARTPSNTPPAARTPT